MAREDMAEMQTDSMSLRAVEGLPGLIRTLEDTEDDVVQQGLRYLRDWDCRMEADRVGGAIFESFFHTWGLEVAAERFEGETARLLGTALNGLALELLDRDAHSWFSDGDRAEAILRAMRKMLANLETRLGPDMSEWTWGAIHKIQLRHHLSDRGEIFQSMDRGGVPVRGNGVTLCNTGFDPNYLAVMGANYRINAELADDPPGLWAVDAAGQSGHPGSPNYCDQLKTWLEGNHHYIPLDRQRVEATATGRCVLTG
jgi:penicillin amidase